MPDMFKHSQSLSLHSCTTELGLSLSGKVKLFGLVGTAHHKAIAMIICSIIFSPQ